MNEPSHTSDENGYAYDREAPADGDDDLSVDMQQPSVAMSVRTALRLSLLCLQPWKIVHSPLPLPRGRAPV